jgi:hypothetical protein
LSNQPISQSINQSTNQSINQPIWINVAWQTYTSEIARFGGNTKPVLLLPEYTPGKTVIENANDVTAAAVSSMDVVAVSDVLACAMACATCSASAIDEQWQSLVAPHVKGVSWQFVGALLPTQIVCVVVIADA